MSSAVYLFMNRYTDITPALYSEREAEESSLMGRAGVGGSGNAPAGSSWNTVIEPLQWDGQCAWDRSGLWEPHNRRDLGKPGRGTFWERVVE